MTRKTGLKPLATEMKFVLTIIALLLVPVLSRAAGEVTIPLSALTGGDAAAKRVMSALRPADREILRRRMQAIYEQGIRKGARQGDISPPSNSPAAGTRPPAKKAPLSARTPPPPAVRAPVTAKPAPVERASDYVKFVDEKSKDGVYTVNFVRNTHYKRSVSVTVNGSRMILKPREKRFLARNSPYSIPVALKMQSPAFVASPSPAD